MQLDDVVDMGKLQKHVASGEIKERRHLTEPLRIYNYSARCQFENVWTHETMTCRGLIVNDADEIVARPFPKFFNLGQRDDGKLPIHEPHSIYEKLDGSLGVAYVRPSDGGVAISTRGAFHSPQAEHATEWLKKTHPQWRPEANETWLFEIIYAGSRVVVDYGDRDELVLLTVINTETGRDLAGDFAWAGATAKRFDMKWDDMLSAQRDWRGISAEGFVVRFHNSGLRVKVKTDDYARLHRLVCGLSARSVWEVLSTGASMDEFLSAVPDEFMAWVKGKADAMTATFREIEASCQDLVSEITKTTTDRKALAEIIKARSKYPAVCFKMLGTQHEDKEMRYAGIIWKSLYPPHETFRSVNEDVA